MDPLSDYDFCDLTDHEQDPFSDYDYCNSTGSDQGPHTDSDQGSRTDSDNDALGSDQGPHTDSDTDSLGSVDLNLHHSDEIQIFSRESILHSTWDVYAALGSSQRTFMAFEDIIKEHALPFLPAKSLLRCRAVCKKWDSWIRTPIFAHTQSNNFREISGLIYQRPYGDLSLVSLNRRAYGIPKLSSFLPEDVDIRATSGGLICCQGRYGDNAYYVCNPANKEWNKLPKPTFYHGYEPAIVLAFEPSPVRYSASYDLVCAFQLGDNIISFELYSSRTNTWRVSDTMCTELEVSGPKAGGFYLNGYAYMETLSGIVLALNVRDGTLGFVALPPTSGPHGVLAHMHGELCYILPITRTDGLLTIEIYGNVNMSLQKTFHIDHEIVLDLGISWEVQALTCVNDDTLIFLAEDEVIAYNVKTDEAKHVDHVGGGFGRKYLPYVNSLVPVAPLVRVDESEFCDGICSGKTLAELSVVENMF